MSAGLRLDALEDEDGVVTDLEHVATEDASAGGEVERGQLDLVAAEEALEVAVEVGEVDGVEGLKVVGAVVVAGGVLAVDVVVVEGDAQRVEQVGDELHLEAFAEGGLARR